MGVFGDRRETMPLEPIEIEILKFVAQGLKNEEIAARLSYSVDTIKWRLKGIYSVLEVSNRIEAVNLAREYGLLLLVSQPPPTPVQAVSNPYRGLKTFQTADSLYFFGRERQIQQIIQSLAHAEGATPFIAIVGPSGIGKSSLINAGLIPQLKQGALDSQQDWVFVRMTPGSRPMFHLREALAAALGEEQDQASEQEASPLVHLVQSLGQRRALVVIDQFEELYSLVRDEAQRRQFNQFLVDLLRRHFPQVYVVILLRADFLDRPLQDADLGAFFGGHVQFITPLEPAELDQAIVSPAAIAGLSLDAGLSAEMVADVYRQPGTLPLLQFVMAEMFERREGNRLTLSAYHELGGAASALSRQVELIYEGFEAEAQDFTRRLFLDMVAVTPTGEFARRRTRLTTLQRLATSETVLDNVIDTYVSKRILTLGWDDTLQTAIVELAHEALLILWPRLNEWCLENRDTLRFKQQLDALAQEWLQSAREDASLLAGVRLDRAFRLILDDRGDMDEDTRTYVEISHRHEAKVRQEKEAQLRHEQALRLAASASTFLPGREANAEVAALLAIQSLKNGYSQEADRALLEASSLLYTERIYKLSNKHGDILSRDGKQRLTACGSMIIVRDAIANQELRTLRTDVGGSIYAVRESPDATLLAAGASDGFVYVLNSTSGKTLQKIQSKVVGFTLTFTSNNKWLLFCHYRALGGGIWALDLETGDLVKVAPETSGCSVLAATADNQFFLVAYERDGARLFRIPTGELIQSYATGSTVPCVALSSDSKFVVTGDTGGLARLWDRDSGREVRQFIGHTNTIYSVAVSDDGQFLATGSADGSARLWEIASGKELRRFTGHWTYVSVAFLPDNKLMTWAEDEFVIRVWDARQGHVPNRTGAFGGGVGGIAVSPDGSYVAVSELINAAVSVIERISGETLFKIPAVPGAYRCSVDFSRDSEKLLISRPDGYMEYTVSTGELLKKVTEPDLTTGTTRSLVHHSARYSPDGKHILTSGFTINIARLWNVRSGQLVQTFDGHQGWVMDATFSPNGKYVVTASTDKAAVVWNLQGQPISRFGRHRRGVFSAIFNPSGDSVLSVGDDSVAWLWDAQNGMPIRSFLSAGNNLLYRAAFADEGKLLLIGDGDGKLNIWDAQTGQQVRRFTAQSDLTLFVILPGGMSVLTAGGDNTIGQFDIHIEDAIANVCHQLFDDLTVEERQTYRIADNSPTCPDLAEPTNYLTVIRQDYETVVPETWAYQYTGPDLEHILELYNLPDKHGYGLYIDVKEPSNLTGIEELAKQWHFDARVLQSEIWRANNLQWTIYMPFDNGLDNRFAFAVAESSSKRILIGLYVPRGLFDQDTFEALYRQTFVVTVQSFKLKG